MRLAALLRATVPILPVLLGLVAAEADPSGNVLSNPPSSTLPDHPSDRPPIFGSGTETIHVDPKGLKGRAVGQSLEARGYSSWSAYHDASSADHAAKVSSLSAQGYRMISLSVSGATSNPRYAAVWAKTTGGAWQTIADASQSSLVAAYGNWVGQGYVPTMVSATGPPGSAIFAAVFEKKNVGNWEMWIDQTHDQTYAKLNATATLTNYNVKALAFYGVPDPQDPQTRYAYILHQNRGSSDWGWTDMDTVDSFLASEARQAARGYVPAFVTGNPGPAISWVTQRITEVPNPYTFGGGKNFADYQAYFNQMASQGWYPYSVQVSGGVDRPALYWSLWSK